MNFKMKKKQGNKKKQKNCLIAQNGKTIPFVHKCDFHSHLCVNKTSNFIYNKKGIMDDAVDFMFTVLICFLLLMFIGLIVKGSVDAKNKQSQEYTERATKVSNYLAEKRLEMELGNKIEKQRLSEDMTAIKKLGYVPGSADDPYAHPFSQGLPNDK